MLQPEKACFLIADISGYTEYLAMVEIDHAQDILADLISTVVTALRPNFRLSKLEGDAAFCFAPADKVDASTLLDTIERCYFGFRRRRRDVRQATSCECNACIRIPNLNLKFVAHHGMAIRQKIAGREELLGSDVITVHRLLKNDIVSELRIPAYAAFTDKLVDAMEIDPEKLGMRRHSETYEHLGEVGIWVHDLERRWQEEDARERVMVTPEAAIFEMSADVAAPPQVVWEFATTPGRRLQWQAVGGITGVEQQVGASGRRGVGTVNHCMHGPNVVVEKILDWRPFDYYTYRSTMPGGAPTLTTTFTFEPTATGTRVRLLIGKPSKKSEIPIMEQLKPMFEQSMLASIEELKTLASQEATDRSGGPQPALPAPRNSDGFLEKIKPIQYVG
ncbi:MAG: DUF2652 domain-containing protein [Candidatus Limnocylindrales bacterium]